MSQYTPTTSNPFDEMYYKNRARNGRYGNRNRPKYAPNGNVYGYYQSSNRRFQSNNRYYSDRYRIGNNSQFANGNETGNNAANNQHSNNDSNNSNNNNGGNNSNNDSNNSGNNSNNGGNNSNNDSNNSNNNNGGNNSNNGGNNIGNNSNNNNNSHHGGYQQQQQRNQNGSRWNSGSGIGGRSSNGGNSKESDIIKLREVGGKQFEAPPSDLCHWLIEKFGTFDAASWYAVMNTKYFVDSDKDRWYYEPIKEIVSGKINFVNGNVCKLLEEHVEQSLKKRERTVVWVNARSIYGFILTCALLSDGNINKAYKFSNWNWGKIRNNAVRVVHRIIDDIIGKDSNILNGGNNGGSNENDMNAMNSMNTMNSMNNMGGGGSIGDIVMDNNNNFNNNNFNINNINNNNNGANYGQQQRQHQQQPQQQRRPRKHRFADIA